MNLIFITGEIIKYHKKNKSFLQKKEVLIKFLIFFLYSLQLHQKGKKKKILILKNDEKKVKKVTKNTVQ